MKKIIMLVLITITLLSTGMIQVLAAPEVIGGLIVEKTTNGKEKERTLQEGEVEVFKSSTYTKEGNFNIEVIANGKPFEKIIEKNEPYNIVFVLDSSGSMWVMPPVADPILKPKAWDAVQATNNAIKKLYELENVNISIVIFDSEAKTLLSFSEYNSIRSQYPTYESLLTYLKGKDTSEGTNGKYSAGLIGTYYLINGSKVYSGNEEGRDLIKPSNNTDYYEAGRYYQALSGETHDHGSTNMMAGFSNGFDQLKNAPNKANAVPIMIYMTDGEPNFYACKTISDDRYNVDINNINILKSYSDFKRCVISEESINVQRLHDVALGTILQGKYTRLRMNEINSKTPKLYTVDYDLENSLIAKAIFDPSATKINAVHMATPNGIDSLKELIDNNVGKQIWTNSSLEYSYPSDLRYATKNYTANTDYSSNNNIISIFEQIIEGLFETKTYNPVKAETYIEIKDVIGNDFIYNQNLKVNINQTEYILENNTVTSSEGIIITLDGKELNVKIPAAISDKRNVISFIVELTGREEKVEYKTNEEMEYTFTPNEGNPHYIDKTPGRKTTVTGTIILNLGLEIDVPDTGTFIWAGLTIGFLALITGGYFLIYKRKKHAKAE